jgi:hypothetical protein
LHTVKFGREFNHDITAIEWPLSFRILYLNSTLDISNLLVDTLTELDLGYKFDHDISNVRWNQFTSLLILNLGDVFDQDLTSVEWPPMLHKLTLGDEYYSNLSGITWPQSLYILTLGYEIELETDKINFANIGIINDKSNNITINSCKFPQFIKQIFHYEYIEYMNLFRRFEVYQRPTGVYTKGATH